VGHGPPLDQNGRAGHGLSPRAAWDQCRKSSGSGRRLACRSIRSGRRHPIRWMTPR
jgi:hypothetical protein